MRFAAQVGTQNRARGNSVPDSDIHIRAERQALAVLLSLSGQDWYYTKRMFIQVRAVGDFVVSSIFSFAY
jgi:hypothetical protein